MYFLHHDQALDDETPEERENRQGREYKAQWTSEAQVASEQKRCRDVAVQDMQVPPAIWDALINTGYNATEALGVVQWATDMAAMEGKGQLKWEALRVPPPMRNRWDGVEMEILEVGRDADARARNLAQRSHVERIHLANSSYNSEPYIQGLVYHPFIWKGSALEGGPGGEGRVGGVDLRSKFVTRRPAGVENEGGQGGMGVEGGRMDADVSGGGWGMVGGGGGEIEVEYVDAGVLGEDAVQGFEQEVGTFVEEAEEGGLLAGGDKEALGSLVAWVTNGTLHPHHSSGEVLPPLPPPRHSGPGGGGEQDDEAWETPWVPDKVVDAVGKESRLAHKALARGFLLSPPLSTTNTTTSTSSFSTTSTTSSSCTTAPFSPPAGAMTLEELVAGMCGTDSQKSKAP